MSKDDVDPMNREAENAMAIAQQRIRKMDEESNQKLDKISAEDKAQQGGA